MSTDAEDHEHTLARPKGDGPLASADSLPVEPAGKYAHPATGEVELGRGGMGRVVGLEDVHLGREVAVKELLTERGKSSEGPVLKALFIREAQVLARLEHPGVVPVYELGRRADGAPYYSMRRVRGRPLTTALAAAGSLDERLSLLPHLIDVAHTMGFAHARGVVHRDLKPDNVMVGPFGETLVVDWGLALVDAKEAEGQLAGTPAYMSPEQVDGRPLDARSDVWSMGVMLYELLCGAPPFAGGVTEVLNDVKSKPVPPIRKREARLPRSLVAVLERALSRDPAHRFSDGEAFAVALEAALRSRERRLGLPLLLTVLALTFAALWLQQRAQHATSTVAAAQAQQSVAELEQARSNDLARAAALELRSRDGFAAASLAREALRHGDSPLARGVLVLSAERGVPRQQWRAVVEAGCARVGVIADQVVCSTLNGVERFEAATGRPLPKLSAGPAAGWLPALTVIGDSQVLAGADNRVLYRWQLARPQTPETVTFPASITALASARTGVLVGLRDGSLFLQTSQTRQPLPAIASRVKALAAHDDTWAVGGDATLRVVGPVASSLDRTALALDHGSDGHLYAAVERSVIELDQQGRVVHVMSGHLDTVTAVSAGERLVSADAEGTVRVWLDDGELDLSFRAFAPGVTALEWSRDERTLFVAPRARVLEAWEVPAAPVVLPDEGEPTFQAYWSRGWLLTGLRDGRIRKIDTATQRIDFVESKHEGPVRAVVDAHGDERPASPRQLSGGDDGRVLLQRWNGEVEVLDSNAGHAVTALDVALDGSRASWAFDDGTVVLYALREQKEVRRVREAVARAVRFSPDSRSLAWGRDDKRVVLVDAQSGAEQGRLEETDAAVLAVRWAEDSVVTALANGQVMRWGRESKRVQQVLSQPTDRVTTVELSPDGALLAAGCDDGHVYVWRLDGGELLVDIPAEAGRVLTVAFVDATSLFAAGTDRQLHVFELAWP